MSNYNPLTRKVLADIGLGMRVDRATAALPATTTGVLFNVEGGRVLLTLILGEVTTVVQTQGDNTKLQSNPDTGTTTDLCAVLDVTAAEAGTLFTITGAPATAMVKGSSGCILAQATPVVVAAGAIELVCAATNTGSVKWSVWYLPLDDGAYVEAA